MQNLSSNFTLLADVLTAKIFRARRDETSVRKNFLIKKHLDFHKESLLSIKYGKAAIKFKKQSKRIRFVPGLPYADIIS